MYFLLVFLYVSLVVVLFCVLKTDLQQTTLLTDILLCASITSKTSQLLINGISDRPAYVPLALIVITLGSTMDVCNKSQNQCGDVFNAGFYPWG
jgi:hypothetical protein